MINDSINIDVAIAFRSSFSNNPGQCSGDNPCANKKRKRGADNEAEQVDDEDEEEVE